MHLSTRIFLLSAAIGGLISICQATLRYEQLPKPLQKYLEKSESEIKYGNVLLINTMPKVKGLPNNAGQCAQIYSYYMTNKKYERVSDRPVAVKALISVIESLKVQRKAYNTGSRGDTNIRKYILSILALINILKMEDQNAVKMAIEKLELNHKRIANNQLKNTVKDWKRGSNKKINQQNPGDNKSSDSQEKMETAKHDEQKWGNTAVVDSWEQLADK